jgi:hypothetical protein
MHPSTNKNARPPGDEKEEEKRQPSPKDTPEHCEASIDEEGYDKDIHGGYDSQKCGSGSEWSPRDRAAKIGERDGHEYHRSDNRMKDQGTMNSGYVQPHAHCRAA